MPEYDCSTPTRPCVCRDAGLSVGASSFQLSRSLGPSTEARVGPVTLTPPSTSFTEGVVREKD
eukprot:1319853-Prymnesium_polylepis.1